MKRKTETLVAVAMAGLMLGFTAPKAFAGDAHDGAAVHAEGDKASCKGKEGCKGKESCKGKEAAHDKNSCKGKEGCKAKESCKAKEAAHGAEEAAPEAH